MLEIAADKVAEVIILARDLDHKTAEFNAFIAALNEDERAHLTALMWVGRGSFEPEDWQDALATAYREASIPTGEYLKGSLHLAEHLENGLEALGISAHDAEDSVY